MKIVDGLIRVTTSLEDANVPYAICGGLVVAIHGCPRLTVDIDLVVPGQDISAAARAVAKAGFDVETGWVAEE